MENDESKKVSDLFGRAMTAHQLGASKPTAGFIASSTGNPSDKYRVRYGYINDARKGSEDPMFLDEKYLDATDFDDAMKRYKELGWLNDFEPNKRRYASIQRSVDGGETWPTEYFYDTQKA